MGLTNPDFIDSSEGEDRLKREGSGPIDGIPCTCRSWLGCGGENEMLEFRASLASIVVSESLESSRRGGRRTELKVARLTPTSESDESMRTCVGRNEPDDARSGWKLLSESDEIIREWRRAGRELGSELGGVPARGQPPSDSEEFIRRCGCRLRFPDHSEPGAEIGERSIPSGGDGSPTVPSSRSNDAGHSGSGVDSSERATGSGVESSDR